MISLEKRLLLGLSAVLSLVFVFLLWASVTTVRAVAEAHVLTRLEHDAEALVAAYGRNPRGEQKMREGRITPIYQQPLSGHYFVVSSDDGTVIRSRSLWDEDLAIASLQPGDVQVQRQPGPAGQQLLARVAGYEKGGMRFTLLVAEDLTPMLEQIARFRWRVMIMLGGTLLAIVLLQRFILRRGFVALDRVRAEIGQVSDGTRQGIAELGPSEVRPLTLAINRLLQQLQQRLQRSRNALGNLAHALKVPLAVLVRDAESLPMADADRVRMLERLDRIRGLVDRELKRARIAGDGSGRRFMPATDVPELVAAVSLVYRDRDLQVRITDVPEGALPFDYEDMLELLGNLLDNACKWARRCVELAITRSGDACLFVVADDGEGVDRGMREDLLRRGVRYDEQTAGHGLGLAIVKDLVDDYQGQLALERSHDLGGLEVRVRLPLVATDAV